MAVPDDIAGTWARHALPALEDYTRIECLSPDFDAQWRAHGRIDEAAALLARYAGGRAIPGLEATVHPLEGRTPVLVLDVPATPGAAEAPPVLVYGHLDKQPPQGAWRDGLGPYTPVRDGDRLYGRGTADDGYALFAATTALSHLAARDAPRPRVVVLIEASEESGSPDLGAHLDALAPVIGRPGLVVCLDSGCLTYDRLWTTSSLRGNVVLTVTVSVLTEGVHSGVAGGVVPSSFRILRRLLSRIEDERTGEILLPSLRAAVPESHRREAAAVAADLGDVVADELPLVDGLALPGDATEHLLRRTWGAALSVTGLDGAPRPEDAGNVLRPFTRARLSMRLPPSVDATAAADELASVLGADPPEGAQVGVALSEPADGWVAPEPAPWIADALGRASAACFGRPPGSQGEGGTIPFLAELGRRYPGTPMVATGVLGPHSNAHGPNEFLHLPMAEAVTVAVAELIAAAAAVG